MISSRVRHRVQSLLDEMEAAWSGGRWTAVICLAQEVLDFDPQNQDAAAFLEAAKRRGHRELQDVARSLDCYPVLSFLTDSLNRIQWVNRAFARTIGDPVRDRIPLATRFVPAAIAGPYRDRFPRWKKEISSCLASLHLEVGTGNLDAGTLKLIDATLRGDGALREAALGERPWDGTMVIRDENGKSSMVREQVLALIDDAGRPTGFHATLWFPADADEACPPDLTAGAGDSVQELLTPRQLEIARLYAAGMTAEDVANTACISWRTARDHLEEVYCRLGVHSRAELTLRLARAHLV